MNETIIIVAVCGEVHMPVDIACCLDEAIEIIRSDRISRSAQADDFCPEFYILWKRGNDGRFTNIDEHSF